MNEPLSPLISNHFPETRPSLGLALRDGDIFVHAPGFEDRTLAFAIGLTATGAPRAILLDYRPAKSSNKINEIRMTLERAKIICDENDVIEYDRFEPGDFELRLSHAITKSQPSRVVIDISSMSKLAILLVLNTCRKLDLHIAIFYAEAESYGPSELEFSQAKDKEGILRPSIHSFNGVHGVVRVDSLASVAMQGQPTAAIVFMSFNSALTQLLLNTVYPSRLFLINSRPPVLTWREIATAWVHENVRKEWEGDNPIQIRSNAPMPANTVSTLDYRESVSLLLTLYWKLSVNHRIVLAPSGSKMQTVACYFVKALHPDIHIEYPSPDGFLPEYSNGVGPRWLLELGNLSALLESIRSAEQETYLHI